jgi:hypothetical protein
MLRCPECGLAHFPDEVHRESERGLSYNARLLRAQSALAGKAPEPVLSFPCDVPVEDDKARLALAPVREAFARARAPTPKSKVSGKGGRPPGPKPWKDRMLEHRRAYMRGYRARRKATPAP